MTVDPLVRVSMCIAKRKNCWGILKDFHCQQYIKFFDVNCGHFMRLYFSIGWHDYGRTARNRENIHFSIIQVLFADHVRRRSGVDNKFSFLRFKGWGMQVLELRWRRSAGEIIPCDWFRSRMSVLRTTTFVNITHRIGFRMFELFRKIDEDFGSSWSPNCRVIFNMATAILSQFFWQFWLGCSSFCRCV